MDQEKLLGFIRVRINNNNNMKDYLYSYLKNVAFVRELHVYGTVVPVCSKKEKVQHLGIGKALMNIGQLIALWEGKREVVVISGVGVRDYYTKHKFYLKEEGQYMYKYINYIEIMRIVIQCLIIFIKNII